MFHQKATETVTLTRPQLQAILEIISQIGGVNRSDSWNESNPRHYRSDNKLMFTDYSDSHSEERQSFRDNSQWVRHSDDLLATDFDNNTENNGRVSQVMLNDNPRHNQVLSPTLSNSSKLDEFRADSVMTNDTKDSNFRRYARINDSEFDWNEYHRKQIKALEYSKALAQQHHDKQIKKMEEKQRRRAEEQRLDKRIEEQRIKMMKDFEKEQKVIQDKRLSTEKKREAVIAAIERTPIIKKRNFLVESPTEPQPVAAIKPQTRGKEISTQTERQIPQYCDTGSQTDVMLLLYLLNEMNLLTKEKSKSEETLSKNSKSITTGLSKKYKSNLNVSQEKANPKREVWTRKQNVKGHLTNENQITSFKSETKENNEEKGSKCMTKNESDNNINIKEEIDKTEDRLDSLRRKSLNIPSSDDVKDKKKKRVMSSVDLKSKIHFLPQISARPHSRKKWYSQETFDPTFLK